MSTSHISVRDAEEHTPKELYGFIYDIPRDADLTNKQLTEIFKQHHIDCQIQIKRDDKKQFYSGRVKFMNSVHLRVAS